MTLLALVGCGAYKRDEPAPAAELYTSSYFSLKRQYAEAVADEWFILSAKHGLVDPEETLEPYELSLDELDRDERDDWGRSVVDDLVAYSMKQGKALEEIIVLAGSTYREAFLEDFSEQFPWTMVTSPFNETRGIHEQMSLLSSEVEEGSA